MNILLASGRSGVGQQRSRGVSRCVIMAYGSQMSILITRTPLQRPSAWRAGFVLVPLLLVLGGLSARFSGSTEDNAWYQTLTLPALQPPGPVFGIAWSILYTLIAVSAALVWGHKRAPGRTPALVLFAVGVVINLAWSPAFFRFHLMTPALGIIAMMLIVAVVTTFAFGRVSRLAAWLLVPYLVWLCFAGALNASIVMLNPAADAFQLGI